LARQVARDDHRIGRHLADELLTRVAIDDPGRGTDEDPHRDHRALSHDDTLDDFRARTDEAVVLDDHRICLEWLQDSANADAAGEVAVLADLGTGAHRRPGIDYGAGARRGHELDEGRRVNGGWG